MIMKELSIEITIDGLGTVEAETHGFMGKVCESELLDLLGDSFVVTEIQKKDDYYKPVEEDVAKTVKMVRGKR